MGLLIHVARDKMLFSPIKVGWSGVAKVSYILRHRVVQLTLAYWWARPAIFVAE